MVRIKPRPWNSGGESRLEGQDEPRSSKRRAGRGFGQAQVDSDGRARE